MIFNLNYKKNSTAVYDPVSKENLSYKDLLDEKNKYIRWIIAGGVGFFLALIIWAFVESFNSDRPEMEAYKCDNPTCNRIHYRPVSQSN